MDVVKRVLLDSLVFESTQHDVQKVGISNYILFMHRVFCLDCDEQNHHLPKTRYFQLLAHLHGALRFGISPCMEPSSCDQ